MNNERGLDLPAMPGTTREASLYAKGLALRRRSVNGFLAVAVCARFLPVAVCLATEQLYKPFQSLLGLGLRQCGFLLSPLYFNDELHSRSDQLSNGGDLAVVFVDAFADRWFGGQLGFLFWP